MKPSLAPLDYSAQVSDSEKDEEWYVTKVLKPMTVAAMAVFTHEQKMDKRFSVSVAGKAHSRVP